MATTVLQVLGLSHMYVSQVSSYLNLSDITLHLAVSLFDRTLAVVEVEEEQLQITAITCLHLAAKVWMTQFESVQSSLNLSTRWRRTLCLPPPFSCLCLEVSKRLEEKLGEKLEEKLEGKLEEKQEEKVEEKLEGGQM